MNSCIKSTLISFNLLLIWDYINVVIASNGDRTSYFSNCREMCNQNNCSEDGLEILSHAIKIYNQNFFDKLFGWTCFDECQYACMWKTVNAFLDRNWRVPQFYGKWPFIKMLGLQEPASVIFSIMNLITNIVYIRKFRKEVRSDSPCYYLWHIFAFVNINGWIWSTIYHARDFVLTEFLDYVFAYSIVLVSLYCMVIRMIYNKSTILRGIITSIFISFFFNYFAYLSDGHFNYSSNMKLNIITAILSGVGWIIWGIMVRKQRPYYWKILIFYVLIGLSSVLEILDFPPILWIFDAHSLWHLTSVPITMVFYSFITDDCKALRKEMKDENKINKKEQKNK